MNSTKPPFPLSDQAQCLRREIRMRYAVYPGKVAKQQPSFTQADMDREIGLMEAAADTVERMAKNGMFREMYNALSAASHLAPPALVQEIEATQARAVQALGSDLSAAFEECVKLSGLCMRLAEVVAQLRDMPTQSGPAKPKAGAPVASAPASTTPTPPAAAAGKGQATEAQKKEIIHLVNNPAIGLNQKANVLLNIHRLQEEDAVALLEKLTKQIEEHQGPVGFAA